MSGFKLDFENTFEGYGKVEDGYYEVLIEKVYEDATPNGAEHVTFRMVIRNDVDQPYQNYKIWERIWKAKATGKYNMIMFNTIGKAAQLDNGKAYKSLEELMKDYEGKPVLVYVENSTSEHNGKTYENLDVRQWQFSKFPNIQHQFKKDDNNKSSSSNNVLDSGVDISDNDFPF